MLNSKELLQYIANLARINLSEEEKVVLVPQFQRIVDYINKMGELDTNDICEVYNVTGQKNVFRDDAAVEKDIYTIYEIKYRCRLISVF
jgi:aspartyl-tRNA(Asn)/glutamyl-tRNA(Gln) amidotransferase subunit C